MGIHLLAAVSLMANRFINTILRTFKLTSPAVDFIPVGNGKIQLISLNDAQDYREAIETCAPLAAILMLSAEAFSNGTFEVLNASTDNYVRGKYKDWETLLDNPNPFSNRKEFLKQISLYSRMAGYCYALPVYAAGFRDVPESIWLLPPWCVTVELKDRNRNPYSYKRGEAIRRVFFNYGGRRTELKEEELILFKDNTPHIDENTWLPKSVLTSLQYQISMFTSADEAGVTLIQKRGPLGIISNDTKDAIGHASNPDEEKRVQENLQRYGLSRGQWQYIVTSQNLRWVPIGLNSADLRLDENQLKAVKAMCFALGYPFILTPFSDQSTYNNMQQAGKDLYQNLIIPIGQSLIEQLNAGLRAREQNIKIVVSYEDVAAMQQSVEEKGKGRKAMGDAVINEYKNNLITLNRALELLGEDTIQGGDYYYRDSPEYQQQQDMQKLRYENRNNQAASNPNNGGNQGGNQG